MANSVIVWVTDQFVAYHRWESAPKCVDFLQNWHRHVFHVKVGIRVTGLDREQEFFILKGKLHKILRAYEQQQFELSCEMIATEILGSMEAEYVEVSEDGENGAIVQKGSTEQVLPAWETTGKCFVGLEAEGPFQGRITLFIPGSVPASRIRKCVKTVGCDSIYYGAGNDRAITSSGLEAVVEAHRTGGLDLTVEVDSESARWIAVRSDLAMGAVNVVGFMVRGFDYYKEVRAGVVIWEEQKVAVVKRWYSPVNHPYYSADVYVE